MVDQGALEPHVSCPKCSYRIPLTESLAAPLLEAARRDFREQLAAKEDEFSKKAGELASQQEALALAKATMEEQIKQRLDAERSQISIAEAKRAREAFAAELGASKMQLAEAQSALVQNDAKLAEAQKAQADILKKERELADQKRELELTIEKRVQELQTQIHTKARQDAEDALKGQVLQTCFCPW